MMLRWKIRKNTIVGMAAIADAAMMRFSGRPVRRLPDADVKPLPGRGVAVLDQQRPEEVLPHRDRGEDRHHAEDRPRHGQHDPPQDHQPGRAIHGRGVDVVRRYGVEEPLEQEDVERVGHRRQPDRLRRADQVPVHQRQVDDGHVLRHDEHGGRDHQRGEHEEQHDVAEHRAQLGQRVGGGHVEHELEYQRAGRVVEGVPQHPPDVEPVPRLHVVAGVQGMRVERGRGGDRFLGRLEPIGEQEVQRPDEHEREPHDHQRQHDPVHDLSAPPVELHLGDQRPRRCRLAPGRPGRSASGDKAGHEKSEPPSRAHG